jgi:IS30 family transposase
VGEDRAASGHWEGDLLMGKRQTAIGTLVERHTRWVMLFALPKGNTPKLLVTPSPRRCNACRCICGSR